jgi:hypothetical protein
VVVSVGVEPGYKLMGPNGPAAASQQEQIVVELVVWYNLLVMASWDQLKEKLDRYNLTYVWDFDLHNDSKKVQGYRVYPNNYLRLSGSLPPVGSLPRSDLAALSDTGLEEFVVGCAVLSMQPWRV